MRAAIYRRISSSTTESTSLEGQAQQAEAYCLANGWDVVATYTDDGVSGGKDATERPDLGRLLADAEQGRFDVVVFSKLDRLARSLTIWNDTRRTLDGHGVALASVSEGLDLTKPHGRMMANVLQSFAEFERERIGERIRDAQGRMAAEGRFFASKTPYGWRTEKRPGGGGLRLAHDPAQAPRLRAAVDAVLAGTPVGRASRDAREEDSDFPTENGLARLLRNPVLLGHSVYQGQVVVGEDGLPLVAHEPLVTASEFRDLDAAISRNRLGVPRAPSGELRLLNALGVLRCADCDRPMQLQRRKNDRDVYACRRGHVSADADRIEEAVTEEFLETAGRVEVMTAEVVGDPRAAETLVTAAKRREDVAALVAEGLLPLDAAREQLSKLETTISRLEAEVARGSGVEYRSTGRTFAETWAASDLEGRRSLLESSGLRVVVERAGRGCRPPMRERLTVLLGS